MSDTPTPTSTEFTNKHLFFFGQLLFTVSKTGEPELIIDLGSIEDPDPEDQSAIDDFIFTLQTLESAYPDEFKILLDMCDKKTPPSSIKSGKGLTPEQKEAYETLKTFCLKF